MLLREVERVTGVLRRFAACFQDRRDPTRITHPVAALLRQRVSGLALGYEDLNDHEQLRYDPLAAVLAEAADLTVPLAGKRTLHRFELSAVTIGATERDKKLAVDHAAVDQLFVDVFVAAHATPPIEVVLDLDATDDPVHGNQEGRFFHGPYGHYCYWPLYIFAGEHLLCARLRRANIDASAGALAEVERIVAQLRAVWPQARRFVQLTYQTPDRRSRARRVVASAEHLPACSNPRFVVTALAPDGWAARGLYQDLYCARGGHGASDQGTTADALSADSTRAATLRANQRRLYCSSVAYLLLQALRCVALAGTALARAQCQTLRLTLLKIGARVRVTTRHVWLALASGCPHAARSTHAHAVLPPPARLTPAGNAAHPPAARRQGSPRRRAPCRTTRLTMPREGPPRPPPRPTSRPLRTVRPPPATSSPLSPLPLKPRSPW